MGHLIASDSCKGRSVVFAYIQDRVGDGQLWMIATKLCHIYAKFRRRSYTRYLE